MISNILRLFIFILSINILLGFVITSNDNQRIHPLLKQRSAENDNEFVWFTRDIPNEIIKPKQLPPSSPPKDSFAWKVLNRKFPININPTHKIE